MTYNVDLMIKVRDAIRANPKHHDQGTWATKSECGTTYYKVRHA